MESALNTFSGISSPFLLFCVGVFFRFSLKITPQLIFTLAEKLVITPLIFLSLAAVLGFRGGEFLILLAVFAAPTAVVSFAMTQNAGGNATIAGNAVVLSSVFSFFTLFFWISLFMYLGIV